MKTRTRIWGILLAVLMAAAPLSLPAFAAEGGGLLVLGDSIARGTGLAPGEKNFGDLLAESYGLSGPLYENLAVDGLTSGALAEAAAAGQLDGALALYDTVVISIGANDILGKSIQIIMDALGVPEGTPSSELLALIQALPLPELFALISQILADLNAYFTPAMIQQKTGDLYTNLLDIAGVIDAAAAAPPRVYILTLYDPFSGIPNFLPLSNFLDPILVDMNASMEDAAAAAGFTVVDIYTAFKGNPAYTNMALLFDPHPTALGQGVIANKLADVIPAPATPILSADVTVTAPVINATPAAIPPESGTGYTCGPVTWTPTVPAAGQFAGGTAYTATVTLTAVEGCTFNGFEAATINGKTAEVVENTNDTVTIAYTFPATAPTGNGVEVTVDVKILLETQVRVTITIFFDGIPIYAGTFPKD